MVYCCHMTTIKQSARLKPRLFHPAELFVDEPTEHRFFQDTGHLIICAPSDSDNRLRVVVGTKTFLQCSSGPKQRSVPGWEIPLTTEQVSAVNVLDLLPPPSPTALARVFNILASHGISGDYLAKMAGLSGRADVSRLRWLSNAPIYIQNRMDDGSLHLGHLRYLKGLSAADGLHWAQEVVGRKLSVSGLQQCLKGTSTAAADVDIASLERSIGEQLGTQVSIRQSSGGSGELALQYYDLDTLQGLLERLGYNFDA